MQPRTDTEILLSMLEGSGLITDDVITQLRAGTLSENQYLLILASMSRILSRMETWINEIDENMHLDTATGSALDNMGSLFNVHRYQSQAGLVDITISTNIALDQDVTIPAGTRLIIDEAVENRYPYELQEDVTLLANTSSVTGVGECTELGLFTPLPADAVIGIQGYTLNATNTNPGTSGRWIEEDDEYRKRIASWTSKNTRGTKACIDDYLLHYPGITRYKLIPLYDGVGTLKIVCDATSSIISALPDKVYNNCMLVTDSKPVVVAPSVQTLDDITVHISIDWSNMKISITQLSEIVTAQINTYILGGIRRDGTSYAGVSMGTELNPSKLWDFLTDQCPEIANIYSSDLYDVVDVDDDKKLGMGEVVIVYDNVTQ